jgi:hypothetical protein
MLRNNKYKVESCRIAGPLALNLTADRQAQVFVVIVLAQSP